MSYESYETCEPCEPYNPYEPDEPYEGSRGLLGHLRSHLEPSWAILRHLGGHLGLSEALLEPSWAILDAPMARETPRPGPGERGLGGGVNPSQKGKREDGRGNSLNHLRPKGLVDSWTV